MRAMILALQMTRQIKESEISHTKDQGSTPKRKRRTDMAATEMQEPNPVTGTTLEEEFPEEALCLEEPMTDEEPYTLEEGRGLK
jgi:hypothetical protein